MYECACFTFSVCMWILNIDDNSGCVYAQCLLDNAFIIARSDVNVFELTFDFVIIFNTVGEKNVYSICAES